MSESYDHLKERDGYTPTASTLRTEENRLLQGRMVTEGGLTRKAAMKVLNNGREVSRGSVDPDVFFERDK